MGRKKEAWPQNARIKCESQCASLDPKSTTILDANVILPQMKT